jgi:hypothetical protein
MHLRRQFMTNLQTHTAELILRFNQVFAYTPKEDINIIPLSSYITPENEHVCFIIIQNKSVVCYKTCYYWFNIMYNYGSNIK